MSDETRRSLWSVLFGIVVGFLGGAWLRRWLSYFPPFDTIRWIDRDNEGPIIAFEEGDAEKVAMGEQVIVHWKQGVVDSKFWFVRKLSWWLRGCSFHKTKYLPKECLVVSPHSCRRWFLGSELKKKLWPFKTIARFGRSRKVEYAEPNYVVMGAHLNEFPNDTLYQQQWGLRICRIDEAWKTLSGELPRVIKVAVVDSGVDYHHADLQGNIFYAEDGDEKHSHGTLCSGVIGAVTNNVRGVSGVSLRQCLLSFKFLCADLSGNVFQAAAAICQAVECGADVILTAWGGNSPSQCLWRALDYARQKDVLIVAAAGNRDEDIGIKPFYPASFKLTTRISGVQDRRHLLFGRPSGLTELPGLNNILVVSGIGARGLKEGMSGPDLNSVQKYKVGTSNFGRATVDLGAPGYFVKSTRKRINYESERYGFATGTSMAAALVAGTAVLVKAAARSRITAVELRDRLVESAKPVGELEKFWVGGRVLDAAAAVESVCRGSMDQQSVDPSTKTEPVEGAEQPCGISCCHAETGDPGGTDHHHG